MRKSNHRAPQPRRRRRALVLTVVLWVIVGVWATRPEHLRPVKTWLREALSSDTTIAYDADGLYALNVSQNEIIATKREHERLLPASLAKLFVIQYATTFADPDDVVLASQEALDLLKPDSSVAYITAEKNYRLADLYAGMLVASGNDAAYVLADALAQESYPELSDASARIARFMDDVNAYAHRMGWTDTTLHDPSGYDDTATTSAADVADVCASLLEQDWFREMVAAPQYTIVRPDGVAQTFENTNHLLQPESPQYEPAVHGIKTGSLNGVYNLAVLFTYDDEEYLIVSLGSSSDEARYDDVRYVLRSIDGE